MSELLYSLKIEGTEEQLTVLKGLREGAALLREEIKKLEKAGSDQAEAKKIQLQVQQKQYRDLQREVVNMNKEVADGINTLSGMRAALVNMNKQIEKLPVGSKAYKEMTAEATKLRAEINGLDQSQGKFQGNVGNYTNSIIDAFKSMGINVSKVTGNLGGATGATKLFGKAWIATGIGAIVVAVVALIAALSRFEPVVDAVNKVLKPLEMVMQRMIGIAQNLASIFGKILKGEAEWSDLGDAIRNVGSELREAYGEGQRLAAINIELEELAIKRAGSEAKLRREMMEQREVLQDVSKSDAERYAAGQRYIALQKQNIDEEKAILGLEIERLEIKAKQNHTDRAALLELAQARARYDEIEGAATKERLRAISYMNTIQKKADDERAKAHVTRMEQLTKQLEAQDKLNAGIKEEVDLMLDSLLDFEVKLDESFMRRNKRMIDDNAFEREVYGETYAGRLAMMQDMYDKGMIGEKRFADWQKQLDKEVLHAKLGSLSAGLDGIAAIAGEQSKLGKAAAVASALISTYQAANMALANPPGPPWSAIYAAGAVAAGLANVRKIMSTQQPRFAGGVIGLAGAGTGTSDSIDARLSRGESVVTAKATRAFAPVIAEMERAVGNEPNFQLGRKRFAAGLIGQQLRPNTNIMQDYETIIQRTLQAVGSIPVVVSETDITSTQSAVRKIRVAGDLV